jgi:hypothetical protein
VGPVPCRNVCMYEKSAAHCCSGCWCFCSKSNEWDITTTPPAGTGSFESLNCHATHLPAVTPIQLECLHLGLLAHVATSLANKQRIVSMLSYLLLNANPMCLCPPALPLTTTTHAPGNSPFAYLSLNGSQSIAAAARCQPQPAAHRGQDTTKHHQHTQQSTS